MTKEEIYAIMEYVDSRAQYEAECAKEDGCPWAYEDSIKRAEKALFYLAEDIDDGK